MANENGGGPKKGRPTRAKKKTAKKKGTTSTRRKGHGVKKGPRKKRQPAPPPTRRYRKLAPEERERLAQVDFENTFEDLEDRQAKTITPEQRDLILKEAARRAVFQDPTWDRLREEWKRRYGTDCPDWAIAHYSGSKGCEKWKGRIHEWMEHFANDLPFMSGGFIVHRLEMLKESFELALRPQTPAKVEVLSYVDEHGNRRNEVVRIPHRPDVGAAVRVVQEIDKLVERFQSVSQAPLLAEQEGGVVPVTSGKRGKAPSAMSQPYRHVHQKGVTAEMAEEVTQDSYQTKQEDKAKLVEMEGHDFESIDNEVFTADERKSRYERHLEMMEKWEEEGQIPDEALQTMKKLEAFDEKQKRVEAERAERRKRKK